MPRARMPLGAAVAGCLGAAALTLLLPSTPTYDPWAWMTWGRELVALELDTRAGPAVKPLPIAAGALLSATGAAAPWIWLALARAGAILAAVMAWRLARRACGGSRLAGAVAAAGVALTGGFVWNGALGNAEGLLLALALVAAERALDGHPRQALALAFAAALVRTEAIPFVLAYAAWLWRREPRTRPLAVAGAAALPVLWLGPDALGAGDPLRSSERARVPNPGAPALADRPAAESLQRAVALAPVAIWAGALLAVAGVVRRDVPRAVALPLGAGALWILLVAAMSEAGYSGEERYAMPGVALLAVAAGPGAWWAAGRVRARGARWRAALPPVLAGAAVLALAAGESIDGLAADARSLGREARLYGALDDAVSVAGGRSAVLRCGPVHTAPYSRPALAWRLRVPLRSLSTTTSYGGVVFRARPFAGAAVGPPLGARAFRGLGRAGDWRVLTTCGRGG